MLKHAHEYKQRIEHTGESHIAMEPAEALRNVHDPTESQKALDDEAIDLRASRLPSTSGREQPVDDEPEPELVGPSPHPSTIMFRWTETLQYPARYLGVPTATCPWTKAAHTRSTYI
jgi:hypothetical protein